MSKHDTPMIRAWWGRVGGRICEEYPLVRRNHRIQERRSVDALLRPDLPSQWVDSWKQFGSIEGSDVVVVQAKPSRLSLPLLGQAFFSAELARKHLGVMSARAVALCGEDDEDLRPLAEEHGVEVIVESVPRPAQPFRLPPNRVARAAIERFARRVGGAVAHNFPITPSRPGAAGQRAHAAVFFDGPPNGDSLDGRDVMLVSHPRGDGIGMYVLGQAFFGIELVRRHHRPRCLQTAVVITRDDEAMGALARQYGIEVYLDRPGDAPSPT